MDELMFRRNLKFLSIKNQKYFTVTTLSGVGALLYLRKQGESYGNKEE